MASSWSPIRSCSVRPTAEHVAAAERAILSGVWVGGEETAGLEREFAGWLSGKLDPDRVVAVSSGTAALTALLMAQGIGPGDDVIVPAVTFTATGLAVLRAGARPIFSEVTSTFSLCPHEIEKVVTPQTRAIIGVDFDGVPADWQGIERAAVREGLLVIEDACPAYGARYRGEPAGLLGKDGAAFSLNESKQLPGGEGGLVVAPNTEVAERIRRMRHFGHPPGGAAAVELSGDNWKITEVAAALGRAGIPLLHEKTMTAGLVGETLRHALQDCAVLSPPPFTLYSEPSWFRIRAVAPTMMGAVRAAEYLEEHGVSLQRSQEVDPLPDHPLFREYPHGSLENARKVNNTFCIGGRANPVFTLDHAEAKRWAEVITSLPQELVSPRTKEES